MGKVKLSDVVARVKDRVDKDNTDLEYYIGGEHFCNSEICINRRGQIKDSTIGPAFHMRFMPEDVLLMSRNPHLRKAGVVNFEGICSDVSYVCRTKNETEMLQRYLPFVLQTDDFWNFAEANKKGSTNFFLNWSDFERYEFELPPIEKQEKLAELLWAANDTKEAYKKLLIKTDELVKSQFIEMFGDPAKNSMDWKTKKLSECLFAIDSGKSLNCETFPRRNNAPAILKLSAVTYGEYDPSENKELPNASSFIQAAEVHDGDLLFSRKNTYEYVGMSAMVKKTPVNLMLPDLIFRLNTKPECHKVYLWQLINHTLFRPSIKVLASGSTGSMPNISKQRLAELCIPLPPIDLQNQFASFIEQVDKSKFELQQTLDKLNTTITMLMQ